MLVPYTKFLAAVGIFSINLPKHRKADSFKHFLSFIGVDRPKYSGINMDCYDLPDDAVRKIDMMFGPHDATIVKAYLALQSEPNQE